MSRWDWMETTHDGLDDGRCAPAIALALGGRIVPGRARNGYAHAEVVERDGIQLATVYGGSARPGEVHITLTGDACDDGVPLLRRLWPAHRVSRADSAIDFLAHFDELDARAVAFADEHGIKHEVILNSEGGATRYLGGRTSEGRLRLYKKSEQWRALHPERAHEVPDGVVRAEFQARPGKRAAKEAVATLAPDDLWGLSAWGLEFGQLLLQLDPKRTPTVFRRPSDWSRLVHFVGLQYGPAVRARFEVDGTAAVLEQLLAALGAPGARVVLDGEG